MNSFQETQEQRGTNMVPTDWAWFVAMAMAIVGFAAGHFYTLAKCKGNAYANEGITYSYFNTAKWSTHCAMREGR